MKNKSFFPMHIFVACVVFFTGILNIYSSLFLHNFPRLKLLKELIPIGLIHTSRTFLLLAGVFLVSLSFNLLKRKRRAWAFAVVSIIVSIILHLTKGLNIEGSILLLLPLLLLIITRSLFRVESGREQVLRIWLQIFYVLLFLFMYSFFGFYLFQGQFSHKVTIINIINDYAFNTFGFGQDTLVPLSKATVWFTDSIAIVAFVSISYALFSLFLPVIEKYKVTDETKKKIRDIILKYSKNSVSYFMLMQDKRYYIDEESEFVLSYRISGGHSVILGDPISKNIDELLSCTRLFLEDNERKGLKTVFYNTSEDLKIFYKKLGYKQMKIGEEAIIPTNTFSIEGSLMADIRHAVSRINREGGQFEWFSMDKIPWNVINDISALYDQWITDRKSPGLTFSLDYYPFPVEPDGYVLTIYSPANILWGVLSFFPYDNKQGMALDFMIRAKSSPPGIIESGIAEAAKYFKTHGILNLNLGLAPLADLEIKKDANIVDKIRNNIFEHFNQFYGYKSLFLFKKKFYPVWQHKYLAYKDSLDLPSTTSAILQVHLKKKLNLINIIR
jgi:phosphatidylglycerol lysyltransferase